MFSQDTVLCFPYFYWADYFTTIADLRVATPYGEKSWRLKEMVNSNTAAKGSSYCEIRETLGQSGRRGNSNLSNAFLKFVDISFLTRLMTCCFQRLKFDIVVKRFVERQW